MRVLVVFALIMWGRSAAAQEEGSKPRVTIGAGLSIAGTYKIGNAEQFYRYLMNDNTKKPDDGATGYKYLSLGMISTAGKGYFGMDFRYVMTHPSRAIWGNDIDFGHMVDMRFGARFFELAFKVGPKLGKNGGGIVIEPAVLLGTM